MQNKRINKIRQHSKTLLVATLCILGCLSCTQDDLTGHNETPSGRAVSIMASMPDDNPSTKGTSEPKKEFKDGDVIHVYALFTLEGTPSSSTAYGCMEYKGGNWTAKDNTFLNWPWNATKATFTAYYIPPVGSLQNKNALSNDDHNTLPFYLSDLCNEAVKNGTDPLVATYTDVPVESAVYLQFNHIFTKLTITNLSSTDVTEGQELRLSAIGLKDSLVYTRVKNGDQLSHELLPSKSVLINKVAKDGEIFNITYLIPEVTGASIDLRLSFKDYTPYHLVPIKQELKAGKHYSLDITKLADNYIDEALKEEEWNKGSVSENFTTADINAYLQAIRDGKEFRKGNVQILDIYKEGTTSVVTQLVDVNFNDQEFLPVNLSTNIIFNANFHKIKNMNVQKAIDDDGKEGSKYLSLFGKNEGIIKNLIIEGAEVTPGNAVSATNAGLLVGANKGLIDNVKIVFTKEKSSVSGTVSTAYIGALIGENTGTLRSCRLIGKSFSVITAVNANEATCYVGGLIGYNNASTNTALPGNNAVENCRVETESGSTVQVKQSTAQNTIYAGGWAGYTSTSTSGAKAAQCATSASVIVKAGTTVYAGGFAGLVNNQMTNCSATGNVTVDDITNLTRLYVGGFAGIATAADLNGCFATGQIINNSTSTSYIGGFAGHIAYDGDRMSKITNCYAIGDVPKNTDGGFAAFASEKESTTLNKDKITIHNCFSKNNASAFIGNDGATLKNNHHNGNQTVGALNNGKGENGFTWTATPALFGTDFPYLIMETIK